MGWSFNGGWNEGTLIYDAKPCEEIGLSGQVKYKVILVFMFTLIFDYSIIQFRVNNIFACTLYA